jgi:hypothetical protein
MKKLRLLGAVCACIDKPLLVVAIIAAVSFSTSSVATVTQSFGTSSAVSSIDTSADFESTSALDDNPYVEGGLEFSRTNLSFNNNDCGYAGCADNTGFYPGFSGNYMYGIGGSGFFEMSVEGGGLFYGLEFIAGSGWSDFSSVTFSWEAFEGGLPVGSGTFNLSSVSVVGFSDIDGFDTLRYTNISSVISESTPAFDSVRAQLSPTPISTSVTIDIKPDKKTENIIDLNKGKNLKVAIVGDAAFDALQVDPATVTFGPSGASPVRFNSRDYNRDGFSDLILTFNLIDTGIVCNINSATLTGETYGGEALEGSGIFTVQPCN